MNDKNETTEQLLDSIVLGEFTQDEIAATIPAEDREDFLRELSLHRAAAAAIQRYSVTEQVRSASEEFFRKYREAKSEGNEVYLSGTEKIMRLFLWVAAAFVITCSVIVLYWYVGNNGDRLFAERYQPFRVNVERSDASKNSEIARQYSQDRFNEVVAAYEKNQSVSSRDKMIAGSSYLKLNRYEPAIAVFNHIIEQNIATGDRLYHDEAEYYLALAYLKQKQYEQAYQLFDKIYIDKEHTFNTEVNWWFLTRVKWLR
ncbi:MAG: hypothetical protein JNK79_13010 [Chitinophagaceae bacterium]|nr:hypothetical protein [Chitinophagaceae bacterium]